MSSPTQRSLALLRKDGWAVTIVERYVSFAKQRFDAYGFGDLLACKPGEPITLIQTTTAANLSARWHKIIALREAETWLRAGGAIQVHGWQKCGPRGTRKLWRATVRNVGLVELLAERDELFLGNVLPQYAGERE